jgi:hypothetical protein
VPRAPERRDELIHDADHRADVRVLGPLSGERERDAVNLDARHRQHRQPRSDFERGRGREPRARRHVRQNHHVRAREPRAALFERLRDALDVVEPQAAPTRAGVVKVELGLGVRVERHDAHQTVFAAGGGDDRLAVNRHREHEPAVVIRVLAD